MIYHSTIAGRISQEKLRHSGAAAGFSPSTVFAFTLGLRGAYTGTQDILRRLRPKEFLYETYYNTAMHGAAPLLPAGGVRAKQRFHGADFVCRKKQLRLGAALLF
jgi:hypothetical protein